MTRLQGGLGNQLFQYAAAKALAYRIGKPFKLEAITSLRNDRKRNLALNNFQCSFELASASEIRKFIPLPRLYRHYPTLISKFGKNIYRERGFHFDKSFHNLKSPIFLDGFWQSPYYFSDIAPIIKNDFQVKPELIKNNLQSKVTEFQNCESVAVHIRRGDFLNAKAAAYHGILSTEYYTRAIEFIKDKVGDAKLYYFSDDIDWVEKNLSIRHEGELISRQTQSAIEDFHLMTHCRHNIIANSSFSWWPAWLNQHSGKIIIAPQRWFAINTINTSDLIPADWIRL